MQKKIIALAIAAAFAAPAVAMADVTMYGSMDGGVRHQTNDNTGVYNANPKNPDGTVNTAYNPGGGGTTDTMQMGQYNTARFGLKSVEDLGDGMKVNVVLETSLAPGAVGSNPAMTSGVASMDTATGATVMTVSVNNNPFGLLFDRQATIGVEGGLGKFDMGWQYTTSFKVIGTYDPFNYKYLAIAGAASSALAVRAGSMTVAGKFGDVSVMAEYDVNNGNKTAQPITGPGRALGLTYSNGTINAGFAYSAVEGTANAAAATGGLIADHAGVNHITAGAGFDFGAGKASVGYAKKATKSMGADSDATNTNIWLGSSFKATSELVVTAAYYKRATNSGLSGAKDVDSNVLMAGVTYDLSKKTQLYFEADKSTVVGTGGAKDVVTSGVSAGLSATF